MQQSNPAHLDLQKFLHDPQQLSNICWLYLVVNISFIIGAPWILSSFTSYVSHSQLVAVVGAITSLIAAYLTTKIHNSYLSCILIVLSCILLSLHIVLIPQLYLYFLPLLITPVFLACIRFSQRDFYFAATCISLCVLFLWFYVEQYNALVPPFSVSCLMYVVCTLIFMSFCFWMIYSNSLQKTLESLKQTHVRLQYQQKKMHRSNQAKSTFLNHLGHELSLPLHFIAYQRTSLQLMIAHELETKNLAEESQANLYEVVSDLNKIQSACDDLNGLLDDLLQISEESSTDVQINIGSKSLKDMLVLFREAIQSRTGKQLHDIQYDMNGDTLLYLDHERSLKLFCVLVKYVYKSKPHAKLSLHICMNEHNHLVLEMRDSQVGQNYITLDQTLPVVDTPTLSVPYAEPSMVLIQRLVKILNADLDFSNTSKSHAYKIRFILILPQSPDQLDA